MNITQQAPSLKALLPFLVFILLFLGIGISLDDFYAFPSPLAVIAGIATAILLFEGSTNAKINTLLEGCGDSKILTMCLIYLLAGAFASVAAAMGAVESVVNLGLAFISPEMLPVGIFLLAAFLSTATGTSVGSIVALGPIVVGLADQSGVSLVLLSATLLGGSMFGDNLSFISDTTIAATQSLGVKMKDKFRVNFFIALPAALITLVILFFLGQDAGTTGQLAQTGDYSFFKIIPYLLVILLAIIGVNVFVVLFLGTLVAGAMGILNQDFEVLVFTQKVYEGFLGMSDIFLLSLLTGGLAALVANAGGIDYLLKQVNKKIKSKRSAQLGLPPWSALLIWQLPTIRFPLLSQDLWQKRSQKIINWISAIPPPYSISFPVSFRGCFLTGHRSCYCLVSQKEGLILLNLSPIPGTC